MVKKLTSRRYDELDSEAGIAELYKAYGQRAGSRLKKGYSRRNSRSDGQ